VSIPSVLVSPECQAQSRGVRASALMLNSVFESGLVTKT
jgi:hypothetical protein